MKNRFCITIVFVMCVCMAKAQKEVYADLLLSKPMLEAAHGKNIKLLDNICLTSQRTLVLASQDSLYFLGYGGCLSYAPKDKHITAFCVTPKGLFYSNRDRLMQIVVGDNAEESLATILPFVPAKLWGGQQVIYASVQNGAKYDLYVLSPNGLRQKKLLELGAPVVSVLELGSNIHIVTNRELLVLNSRNGACVTVPLDGALVKDIRSALIDRETGWLYVTCANGLFGLLPEGLQKICNDTGTLCYDQEGFVLFDASQSSVIRLRKNLVKPQQKEVIIELK